MIHIHAVQSLFAAVLQQPPLAGLARKGAAALGIKFAGAGLALALQISLARALGQTGYGEYAYVVAWLQLLLIFSQSGMSLSAVRYMGEYRVGRQPGLARGFIRRSTQTALATSVILASVMYAAAATVPSANSANHSNYLIACLALPALAQFALNSAVIRGLGQALTGMLSLLAYPALFLAAIVAASGLLGRQLTVTDALALSLGAAVCAVGVTAVLRRRAERDLDSTVAPAFRTGKWLATATELMIVSGLIYLQGRTGVILTRWLLDTDAAGTYAALERLADAALLGMVSVELLVAPDFAALHAKGRKRDLTRHARLAAWSSTVTTLAVVSLLVIFGKTILGLFGSEFVAGYAALMVMLAGVVTKAMCGTVGLLLCMTGYQRDTIIIACASLLLGLALSVLLIPRFGILGTAAGFASSIAAWNLAMVVAARWRLGVWVCIGNVRTSWHSTPRQPPALTRVWSKHTNG